MKYLPNPLVYISGWLVLNVSKAVRQWQKDYRTNQGLMVPNIKDVQAKSFFEIAAIQGFFVFFLQFTNLLLDYTKNFLINF